MISTRLLGVIGLLDNRHRICWDVKTACLNAECAPSERVPLKYPPEIRQYKTDSNEVKHELFGMLLKNLYGHPAAARNWSKTRDLWIDKTFNPNGYACKKCPSDECVLGLPSDIPPRQTVWTRSRVPVWTRSRVRCLCNICETAPDWSL